MNGSRDSVETLLSGLTKISLDRSVEIAVFPPFPFLQQVENKLRYTGIVWGAQDVCAAENGAFTGEVSAAMLIDFGCQFVIIGHSERRHIYGETDKLIARKCQKALEHGLIPILCVGETLDEKRQGRTQEIVERQLASVLEVVDIEAFAKVVLAYEPVWAIGTGLIASNHEAETVHAFLKHKIAEKNATVAKRIQVLYGGSLKAANAAELFAMPNVNGGLVGGASLDTEEFLKIADILMQCKSR